MTRVDLVRVTLHGHGDAGVLEGGPGTLELVGEAGHPQTGDRRPDLRERLSGDRAHLGDLGLGPLGVDVDEPLGELGLDRDDGERVPEHVVDVPGDPLALLADLELPGHLPLPLAAALEHPDEDEGERDHRVDEDEEPPVPELTPDRRRHDEQHERQTERRERLPDRQRDAGEGEDEGDEAEGPETDDRDRGHRQRDEGDEVAPRVPPPVVRPGLVVAPHRVQVDRTEDQDADHREDTHRHRAVGGGRPGEREDEEDEPDRPHEPAEAGPGVVRGRRPLRGAPGRRVPDPHWRPRLRRTSRTATTAKITPHTTRFVTEIHSGSSSGAEPSWAMTYPSVIGRRARLT